MKTSVSATVKDDKLIIFMDYKIDHLRKEVWKTIFREKGDLSDCDIAMALGMCNMNWYITQNKGLTSTEGRTTKLEIELVPSTVWYSSLYRLLSREIWDDIRNEIIRNNGRRCQICGETEGVMNLHEIWNYDDENHIQKLEGFILLCRMCHNVKHIGLSGILASEGKLDYDEVIKHYCKVNRCTEKEFDENRTKAFDIWSKRSRHQWKQDFGKYEKFIRQWELCLM